jgi:hypothetical protein
MRRLILVIVIVVFVVAVLGPVIWGFGTTAAPAKPKPDKAGPIVEAKAAYPQPPLRRITLDTVDQYAREQAVVTAAEIREALAILDKVNEQAKAPPAPAPPAQTLMQKKLTNAQKLLEGIALADLDTVGKHARELLDLSKQAEFKVLKTPAYELHANDFRRSLDDIQRGVTQKNLDAATLGYMDMTMTCVRCHKHVREVRMAFKD